MQDEELIRFTLSSFGTFCKESTYNQWVRKESQPISNLMSGKLDVISCVENTLIGVAYWLSCGECPVSHVSHVYHFLCCPAFHTPSFFSKGKRLPGTSHHSSFRKDLRKFVSQQDQWIAKWGLRILLGGIWGDCENLSFAILEFGSGCHHFGMEHSGSNPYFFGSLIEHNVTLADDLSGLWEEWS